MPKQLVRLSVFISGTSEMEAEKAALKRVTDELSSVLDKTHGITLRLATFPDTIRPGVNTDPQTEINRQIADCDIYIGLLWSRFGTATARAGSGTQEEFEIALDRFRQDSRSVRIMFYFKRASQDPFAIDLPQLKKVREFRDALSMRGVLYRDFWETPEFIDTFRDNLHHLIIDEWDGDSWRGVDLSSRAVMATAVESELMASVPERSLDAEVSAIANTEEDQSEDEAGDEEFGYFDIAEDVERITQAMVSTLERIADHTRHVGETFQAHTKETELLVQKQNQAENVGGSRTRQEYIKEAKALVNEAGDDLGRYAVEMGRDVLMLREDSRAMISSWRRLISAQQETTLDPKRQAEDREAIARFVTALTESREMITSFQAAIARLPSLTGRFIAARKKATKVLGEFLADVQFLIGQSNDILDKIDNS
jgi:hypothetical protein